ncbi:hypothetical protein DKT68_02160, partial [Micromonospora acroterricola]
MPVVDGGQLGSAGAGTTGGADTGAVAHPPPFGLVGAPTAGDGQPAGGAETDAVARTPGGAPGVAGGGGNGGAGIGPGGT